MKRAIFEFFAENGFLIRFKLVGNARRHYRKCPSRMWNYHMNYRSLWFSLICLACSAHSPGLSYAQEEFSASDVGGMEQGTQRGVEAGEWLWSVSDAPLLRSGATALAVAEGAASTIYIGSFGTVVVSQDGGRTFRQSLRFEAGTESDPIVSFAEADPLRRQQRADALREYLRVNLEEQFDNTYVESMLEEVSDEDLLDADEVTDLEPFQDLELDMDNDLRNAPVGGQNTLKVTNLSNYDSFIRRMRMARSAQEEGDSTEAIEQAAKSPGVWQIRAIGATAYAVTSSAIFVTHDSGNSWQAMLQAAEGEYFLSIDVTPSFDRIAIGVSNGLIISQDGGSTWGRTGENVRGAVYEIRFGPTGDIWALTTGGVFTTANIHAEQGDQNDVSLALQWTRFALPVAPSEVLLHIYQGDAGNIMLLTGEGLYMTTDLVNWYTVGAEVLNDSYIRDIYVKDSSLQSFIVVTDSQILEYNNGWFNQSKGIGVLRNAHIAPLVENNRLAIVTTETGAYFAYHSKSIEEDEAYAALVEQWKREPSYEDTIQAALAAHYLDGSLDKNWRLRSRLAWILPQVRGEYIYRQYRQDKDTDYQKASNWSRTQKFYYERDTRNEWGVYALWDLRIGQAYKNDYAVARLEDMRGKQESVVEDVIEALDQRRSLQISQVIQKIEVGKPSLEDEINYELAMQEAEATLHYLTGGFYIPAVKNKQ